MNTREGGKFKLDPVESEFNMCDDKECFFITPIGDEGSEVRERSNKVMEYIITEAVSDYGYSVTRADKMDQPGSITNQVIQKTVDSELVIADLTGHNPNVFYELAVRHATGEPYIQLIKSNQSIPFDISDFRTIKYGLEVDEADQAKEKIRGLLETLKDGEPEFDNPISESAEIQSLRESADPADQNLAELLETVYKIDNKVEELEGLVTGSGPKPARRGAKDDNNVLGKRLDDLDDGEKKTFNVLQNFGETNQGPITKEELTSIVEEMDISEDQVEKNLRVLMMEGYIYQTGDGAYKTIY